MLERTKPLWLQLRQKLWAHRYDYLRQAFVFAAMAESVRSARKDGPLLYSRIAHLLGPHRLPLTIGLVVLCVGYAAYRFKRATQKWYGTVEVCFGIASGFSIAFNLQPDKPWLPQGATLVGCAYVIARGMDNVYRAGLEAKST